MATETTAASSAVAGLGPLAGERTPGSCATCATTVVACRKGQRCSTSCVSWAGNKQWRRASANHNGGCRGCVARCWSGVGNLATLACSARASEGPPALLSPLQPAAARSLPVDTSSVPLFTGAPPALPSPLRVPLRAPFPAPLPLPASVPPARRAVSYRRNSDGSVRHRATNRASGVPVALATAHTCTHGMPVTNGSRQEQVRGCGTPASPTPVSTVNRQLSDEVTTNWVGCVCGGWGWAIELGACAVAATTAIAPVVVGDGTVAAGDCVEAAVEAWAAPPWFAVGTGVTTRDALDRIVASNACAARAGSKDASGGGTLLW